MEAHLGRGDHGHERSDLEKRPGDVDNSGDSKRPREGDHDYGGAMEMDEEGDEHDGPPNPFARNSMYRKEWAVMHGHQGDFEDETKRGPMKNTYGPVLPTRATPRNTMEVFYIKVARITADLHWPLDVYGDVAVRDSLDHMRNYLFRRPRENCQTLTSPEDSLLELTGPSRAIVMIDDPCVEIDLKVKGPGSPSEDKALSCKVFGYGNIGYRGNTSYAMTEVVSSGSSTVEVRFAHLRLSLEATITVRLVSGPGNFRLARFTASTASIGEDVVLLDSGDRELPVGEDGLVTLRRRVVVVEDQGNLTLEFKATQQQVDDDAEGGGGGTEVMRWVNFPARSALRTEKPFGLGSSIFQAEVAWSLLP
ncbi:hypothetical protein ACP4OV_003152 [Aristida adscensionis]